MKRLVVYVLVIAGTVAALVLLWQFRSVLILLLLSLMLSAALRPSVEFLTGRRVPKGLAMLLVYGGLLAALGLALFLISGPLLEESRVLSNLLVVLYDSTYREWSAGSGLQQAIAGRLPPPDQLPEIMAGPSGLSILQLLFGVTQGAATLLAGLVIVLALSLYWTSDREHFVRLWLSLLPAGQRVQARTIWQTTEASMAAYLRSELVQSVLAVFLLTIAFYALGINFPILTALLAGLAWLIPLAGFLFAAGLSFLAGWLSSTGLGLALGATAITAGVLAFLEFVVEPRFFNRSRFSGLLIIIIMLVLVEAYGLVGFLIAPPLAVVLQIAGSHIITALARPRTTAVEIDALERRLNLAYATYNGRRATDEAVPPEIGSLLERLENLVEQARQVED